MAEPFKFKTGGMMAVPDLSGIAGFGSGDKNSEIRDSITSGDSVSPKDTQAETLEEAVSPDAAKPGYFAPQATIIRVGDEVAIKVIIQTLIRDEQALIELRDKVQTAAYLLERNIFERLDAEETPQSHSS